MRQWKLGLIATIMAVALAAAGLYASDMVKAQSDATKVSCASGGEGMGCGGGGCGEGHKAGAGKGEGKKAGGCGMHRQVAGKSSTCAKIAAMPGKIKPADAKTATAAKTHVDCNGDCGTCKTDCPKAGEKGAVCPGDCGCPADKDCTKQNCDDANCNCGADCPHKKAAVSAETVKPAPKPAK